MIRFLRKLVASSFIFTLLLSGIAGTVLHVPVALADDDGDGDGGESDGGHDGRDGGDDHGGSDDDRAGDDDNDDDDNDDDDHEEAYERRQRGEIASLSGVLHRLRRQYGGRILDVKLRRKGHRLYYRIKLLDRTGHVRKVTVAARPAVRTNFSSQRQSGR